MVLIATEVGIILHLEAGQKMIAFIVEKACIYHLNLTRSSYSLVMHCNKRNWTSQRLEK